MRLRYNENSERFFINNVKLPITAKDNGIGYKPTPEVSEVIAVSCGDYVEYYADTGVAIELTASRFFRENSLKVAKAIANGDRIRISKALLITVTEMLEAWDGTIFECPTGAIIFEGSKEYKALKAMM
jgi:hypothetical protein